MVRYVLVKERTSIYININALNYKLDKEHEGISELVGAIYRNYDRLPAEVQAELPLKQVWMLVAEDSDE